LDKITFLINFHDGESLLKFTFVLHDPVGWCTIEVMLSIRKEEVSIKHLSKDWDFTVTHDHLIVKAPSPNTKGTCYLEVLGEHILQKI
jgi:hypothetical protein